MVCEDATTGSKSLVCEDSTTGSRSRVFEEAPTGSWNTVCKGTTGDSTYLIVEVGFVKMQILALEVWIVCIQQLVVEAEL